MNRNVNALFILLIVFTLAFVNCGGDSKDKLFDYMIHEYAAALKGVFDYKTLGRKFNIPYDELFIVILHETAYAVFEKLHQSGKLEVPDILIGEGDKDKTKANRLISLGLQAPPTPLDEAIETFGKLARLTENNEKELLKYDWSYIWTGHIYDILGEREKAISFYKNPSSRT
jgi:tetratricopeptide (TPR) repeat protein